MTIMETMLRIGQPYRCAVCDTQLSPTESLFVDDKQPVLCSAFECKQVFDQKSLMEPHLFDAHLAFKRKLILDRRIKEAELKTYRAKCKKREKRENTQIRDHVLSGNYLLKNENLTVVSLPSGNTGREKLAENRREKYVEHLLKITNEAFALTGAVEVPNGQYQDAIQRQSAVYDLFAKKAGLKKWCDQCCSICKGGCCTHGAEHAFLSANSIKTLIDKNPEFDVNDVCNLYLSFLPGESISNACINQGEMGCVLPFELRSATCNAFYCQAVKKFQDAYNATLPPDNVLVIRRKASCFVERVPGDNNSVSEIVLLNKGRPAKNISFNT
ncbi:MAG: hypothetical protein OEZ43_02365 [Gammaproteobacteria bacterium]|nr:hypothetical protein [Gammaproteobacteria bacterium]